MGHKTHTHHPHVVQKTVLLQETGYRRDWLYKLLPHHCNAVHILVFCLILEFVHQELDCRILGVYVVLSCLLLSCCLSASLASCVQTLASSGQIMCCGNFHTLYSIIDLCNFMAV